MVVVGGILAEWIEKGATRFVRAVPVDESRGWTPSKGPL